MTETNFSEEIISEGLNLLYKNLGPLKATKFLQILSVPKGDSVSEIEGKTEGITKEKALELINTTRNQNRTLWEKLGLV